MNRVLKLGFVAVLVICGILAYPSRAIVTNTSVQTTTALGNGLTTDFTIGFDFQNNDQVSVILVDETTTPVVYTTIAQGAGVDKFTVSGGDPGTTVVMGTAPTSHQRLWIKRVIPLTQEVHYDDAMPFPAEDHEKQMDRVAMLLQQMDAEIAGDATYATPSNVPQTLVKRDDDGNFSAGTITANDTFVGTLQGQSAYAILAGGPSPLPSVCPTHNAAKGVGANFNASNCELFQTPLSAGVDYQTPLTAGVDYQTPLPSPSPSGQFATTDGTKWTRRAWSQNDVPSGYYLPTTTDQYDWDINKSSACDAGQNVYGFSASNGALCRVTSFAATTPGNWPSPSPSTVPQALDAAAAQLVLKQTIANTPTVAGNWPSPTPSSVPAQLDSLAANKVNTSRTVNGHALSSDVTVTLSDVGGAPAATPLPSASPCPAGQADTAIAANGAPTCAAFQSPLPSPSPSYAYVPIPIPSTVPSGYPLIYDGTKVVGASPAPSLVGAAPAANPIPTASACPSGQFANGIATTGLPSCGAPAGGGTVTSVSAPDGFTVANPTSTPTIATNGNPYELTNVNFSAAASSNTLVVHLTQADGSTACAAAAPCVISFRSATATSAAYTRTSFTADQTITLAATDSIGATASVAQTVYVYAVSDTTSEVCLSSRRFDDSTLVSASALTAGADTDATLLWCTNAHTSRPIRLLGRLTDTWSNPNWGTPATLASAPRSPTRQCQTWSAAGTYASAWTAPYGVQNAEVCGHGGGGGGGGGNKNATATSRRSGWGGHGTTTTCQPAVVVPGTAYAVIVGAAGAGGAGGTTNGGDGGQGGYSCLTTSSCVSGQVAVFRGAQGGLGGTTWAVNTDGRAFFYYGPVSGGGWGGLGSFGTSYGGNGGLPSAFASAGAGGGLDYGGGGGAGDGDGGGGSHGGNGGAGTDGGGGGGGGAEGSSGSGDTGGTGGVGKLTVCWWQ
jgi:hypothetical protein